CISVPTFDFEVVYFILETVKPHLSAGIEIYVGVISFFYLASMKKYLLICKFIKSANVYKEKMNSCHLDIGHHDRCCKD
uniref:Uncharacterized protein n=1 Tax=Romanomermis culicivorax TaxID=13658 RepID=A0A915KS53_ROMCU